MWSFTIPNFTRLFTLVHYTSPAAELGFWRPGRVIAMAVPNRNYELLKNVHFVAVCCPLDSAIPDGRTTHSSPPATPLLIPIKLDENEIFASPLGVLHFTKVIIRENVFILTHLLHAAESFCEANPFSANQEIPSILWNPKAHYRYYKDLPPKPCMHLSSPPCRPVCSNT